MLTELMGNMLVFKMPNQYVSTVSHSVSTVVAMLCLGSYCFRHPAYCIFSAFYFEDQAKTSDDLLDVDTLGILPSLFKVCSRLLILL